MIQIKLKEVSLEKVRKSKFIDEIANEISKVSSLPKPSLFYLILQGDEVYKTGSVFLGDGMWQRNEKSKIIFYKDDGTKVAEGSFIQVNRTNYKNGGVKSTYFISGVFTDLTTDRKYNFNTKEKTI